MRVVPTFTFVMLVGCSHPLPAIQTASHAPAPATASADTAASEAPAPNGGLALASFAFMASLNAPWPARRVANPTCSATRAPGDARARATRATCNRDEECIAGHNGRCVAVMYLPSTSVENRCSYDDCFSDVDCPRGTACVCRTSEIGANSCVAANCRVDSDCGAHGACALSPSLNCANLPPAQGYFCHTPRDACMRDADCALPGMSHGSHFCSYSSEARRWLCVNGDCQV